MYWHVAVLVLQVISCLGRWLGTRRSGDSEDSGDSGVESWPYLRKLWPWYDFKGLCSHHITVRVPKGWPTWTGCLRIRCRCRGVETVVCTWLGHLQRNYILHSSLARFYLRMAKAVGGSRRVNLHVVWAGNFELFAQRLMTPLQHWWFEIWEIVLMRPAY